MIKLIFIFGLFLTSSFALATESVSFQCQSDSQKFQKVVVSLLGTNEVSTYTYTYKLEATDATGKVKTFWLDGEVILGSDRSLSGSFRAPKEMVHVSIFAPMAPDFRPRDSILVEGITTIHMSCTGK